jgi:hypothetical protein
MSADGVGISVNLVGRVVTSYGESPRWVAHRKGVSGHNPPPVTLLEGDHCIGPTDFTPHGYLSCGVPVIAHDPVSGMLRTTAAKIPRADIDRSALGAGTYFAVADEVPGVSYDRVGHFDLSRPCRGDRSRFRRSGGEVIHFQRDQASIPLRVDHLDPLPQLPEDQ